MFLQTVLSRNLHTLDLLTLLFRMGGATLMFICTRTQLCKGSHGDCATEEFEHPHTLQKAQCCEIKGFIKTQQQGGHPLVVQVLLAGKLVKPVRPALVQLPLWLTFFLMLSAFDHISHCSLLKKNLHCYTVNVLSKCTERWSIYSKRTVWMNVNCWM